jgi:hypothetical protein
MLTDFDIERFDSIMTSVMQKREDRGFMVPDRDEERIAEVLGNAERRASEEHTVLVESKQQFASVIRYEESAVDSIDSNAFPEFDNYRNFDFE